jgi:adenylosuccinate lyase
MEARNIFLNLSPLDHRYYLSNRELFDNLAAEISEEASIRSCVRAEVALVKAHLKARGQETKERLSLLDSLESKIDPEEVYQEEEKTKHNIRALVNVMKRKLPDDLSTLVHLGATSVDILDTAAALRTKDAYRKVLLPLLSKAVTMLCDLAEKEAATPQVGRTHGQHAVPITFGFAMAEYVSRLGKSVLRIEELTKGLCGKLAGATGSYNALSMSYADPEAVERDYLGYLGLEPSEHSTQLVEPEYLLRVLLETNAAFGVIANLADDLRNLQRSEIDEIRESFGSDQVGSSTMPQKRNPWNSEHVKSLWKAFSPRVMTFFMDQISEHQRDLTNSASQRFVAEYLAGFAAAVNRLISVLKSLNVNREKMLANLSMSGGAVLAEPAYILLAESGETDGHEIVRKITLEAESEKIAFHEALARHPDVMAKLSERLKALGKADARSFFSKPEAYSGRAAEKALSLSKKYRKAMADMIAALARA